MKKLMFLLFCVALGASAKAQKPNPDYDAALAKEYGADERGMKMYVLVMLKSGTNTTATKLETDSAFKGHFANMGRLVEENKLIVAGPFEKNDKNYRGLFILNTSSLDEAREIVATDPAVKANLLGADLFNWYGSAALAAYLKISEKVGKVKF